MVNAVVPLLYIMPDNVAAWVPVIVAPLLHVIVDANVGVEAVLSASVVDAARAMLGTVLAEPARAPVLVSSSVPPGHVNCSIICIRAAKFHYRTSGSSGTNS